MQNRAVWSARWAHNPEVTGSNPVFAIFFMFNIINTFIIKKYVFNAIYCKYCCVFNWYCWYGY
jgi:hypothetical protein